MLTLVGLGLLSCLTLGFPDSYLLTTKTTVTVPFAGPASFRTTLFVLPAILIGVRAYLQIYVDHWHRLDRISQHFRLARDPTVSVLRHPLLRLCTGFVLYALVPLVLGVFTYEAMVFPKWAPIMLALAITVAFVQVLHARWRWPVTIVPSILLLAIVAIASYQGFLDTFRRPFQLQLANLDRANLEGQDFYEAVLVTASLRNTNIKFANLSKANLWRADLSGSNLKGSELKYARLGVANLSDGNLKCANFEHAKLHRSILHGADLKGADLRFAILEETELVNAKLSLADLSEAVDERADFQGATFCCTKMPNGELRNDHCQNMDLRLEGIRVEEGCNREQYCDRLISLTRGETEGP